MSYPSVNFQPTTQVIGTQPINQSSSTKQHPLGQIIQATDVTYGSAEFIYLKGVASTAKGDVVVYDSNAATTLRAVAGDSGSTGPVAIAMSANVASQYGWYATSGSVPANAATASADTQAHLSASAGQIDDATGTPITGLLIKAATSGGFATVQLSRPSVSPESSGSNSGDVTIGTFGSTPDAKAMSISGQVISGQPADGTHPGHISLSAQTMGAGIKTFPSAPLAPGFLKTGPLATDYQGVSFNSATTYVGYGSGGELRITDQAGNSKLRLAGTQAIFTAGILLNPVATAGTSYVHTAADGVIFMSNDAVRTLSLLAGSSLGSGAIVAIVDSSGSSNASNTITITPVSGTINGAATLVITPGTNKAALLVTNGTNWFILGKL